MVHIKKYTFLVWFFLLFVSLNQQGTAQGWKAGAAKALVTPQQSIWLAGYGSRDHPSEGKETDLWAKALVLEDAKGKKALLVTIDNVGIGKEMTDHLRKRLKAEYGLETSQFIFNCSHTHSGPVLLNFYTKLYPLNPEQYKAVVDYTGKVENQIIEMAGKAIKSMKPAQIYASNGITRFQVNRRNNVEKALNPSTELKGPNDYAVPVIKAADEKGNIIAIAFGYACHATTTGFYKWSADYPGFAQTELEKSHPGITALFFQGAGADQNPLPRGSIALAQQYGRELAAAVERVLQEDMKLLPPQLSTAYSEVVLPYADLPSKEELTRISDKSSASPSWQKEWASKMLERIAKGDQIEKGYPCYPCQVWNLGGQAVMTLGGELVVEYALKLKQIFGQEIFVMGYTNDVMSYIPSPTIIKEGGYEGERSQLSTGLPGAYKPEIESIILNEMKRLAGQTGLKQLAEKQ